MCVCLQRKNEVVYADFDKDTNTPLAGKGSHDHITSYTHYMLAGRHCQHVETSSSGNVATNWDMDSGGTVL